jgi:YfiH family protein
MLILRSENLQDARIAHGFFGRTGGVSTGIYASLNCGTGSNDEREAVTENRNRAVAALTNDAAARLVTCYQVHSAEAVTVTEPWEVTANPKADAMVTDRPGIILGVLTADCAPVLLADRQAKVIGTAHAGWKGAISGVIESVVSAMTARGADRSRICAAVGPCISQAAYEVGPEFEARFREEEKNVAAYFAPASREGHFRFDLERFVADKLGEAGIGSVARLSACTYVRESEFFSYRRTTHRKEPDYGRQLSAIMLVG